MGLAASQGRLLLLTARQNDLEYQAQMISQRRLELAQRSEQISAEYEAATTNRQMKICLFLTGGGEDGSSVQRTTNLTYANLISGTLAQYGSSESGIASYERTEDQEYASNSAYRLVDCSGAIVVSDVSEIPTKVSSTTEKTTTEAKHNGETVPNIYQAGKKTIGEDGEETFTRSDYYALAQEGSALADFLANNKDENNEKCSVTIDVKNGLISAVDKDGNTKYFVAETGEEAPADAEDKFDGSTKGTLVASKDEIPKTKVTRSTDEDVVLEKGNDGKYSLIADGVVIQRYVVDETLKCGSTDTSGATDGPNYLQDCLRNGKYLIEKAQQSTEEGGEVKWKAVSWDALGNIQDSYYLDDDDAAKAKYDREIKQVQALETKLDMELKNVESQYNAAKTEAESVNKIIENNIEGFNWTG